MISLLRKLIFPREVFFHEDDYCQQQLTPSADLKRVSKELQNISNFSDAHRASNGIGWTDMYLREDSGRGFGDLGVTRSLLDATLKGVLIPYETVRTGYSSYRELCRNTGAWGLSESCCLFADWNDSEIVQNVWSSFFDGNESSVQAAAKAVHKIAHIAGPLAFVDWAWNYTCDASDEAEFIDLLSKKLQTMEERRR